ncbi:MAG: hypothetical protein ACI39C_07515 [Dietzia sp.]
MSSELNLPYALELAAMSIDRGQDLSDVAEQNGLPKEVFDRAVQAVHNLPEAPRAPSHWVHALYLIDGWVRGYIDEGRVPTPWVCGQLAAEHYRSE